MSGSRFFQFVAALLVLVIGSSVLTAASAARLQDEETPVQGGVLRTTISEDGGQLDPARQISLNDFYIIHGTLYDTLVYLGEDGLPAPWIAESWTVSDDALTITFKIRTGIKFHDGTDLDAAAVAYNYTRMLDPSLGAISKSQLGTLTSVEATDATTAVFHFSAPYAPIFTGLAGLGIASPTAIQKYGDDFGHHPVGSGPFMFKEWIPGNKIVLERNPNYVNYRADDKNKGPAYVDELEFNVISEHATQAAAFEAGELDIIDAPREDVARLAELPGVTILYLKDSNNINFLEFANRPPYNNEFFRKAVAYSLDREAIAEIAYTGNATPNLCPMPIGDPAYDAELCAAHGYPYDLDKARQMLADGGFVDTDDNGIVEFEGKDLEITLWSYAPFPVQQKTIEIIQPDLNKIGIKTEIQTIEFAAMQPMLQSGEIGIDYMRWTYSDQTILSLLLKSPGWTGQSNDPELDKLLAVADSTVDPAVRLEATHQAMIYALDHASIAPINSDWLTNAASDKVHGHRWDGLYTVRYIDVWLSE